MKRSEDDILIDILDCYCGLSPENLCCDGEASVAETNRRYKKLVARLRVLREELGRDITEGEVYAWYDARKR